jgi:hypothetical protein
MSFIGTLVRRVEATGRVAQSALTVIPDLSPLYLWNVWSGLAKARDAAQATVKTGEYRIRNMDMKRWLHAYTVIAIYVLRPTPATY